MRLKKLLNLLPVVAMIVLPITSIANEICIMQPTNSIEWELVEEEQTKIIIPDNPSDTEKELLYSEDEYEYYLLAKKLEEKEEKLKQDKNHTNDNTVEVVTIEEPLIPIAQEPSIETVNPVVEAPIETYGGGNRWGITLTNNERETLAKVVWLEAGNQGLIGQMYVVGVIFNRVVTPGCAGCGSVIGVMSAKGQFTVWSYHNRGTPTEETYLAIDQMLNGTAPQEVYNANYLFFQRAAIGTKIGDHYFH